MSVPCTVDLLDNAMREIEELKRKKTCRWEADYSSCGKVCLYTTECGRSDGRIFEYCQYCGGKVKVE